MHILILNWRDIKNPAAGGAEQLTHQIAKRWVEWGHKVIQISAGYPKCQQKEIIDGVQIVRLGRWWSVHFLAFWYYLIKLRKSVNVIIDEVHWFPFFSRLYAKNKTILLVCEVANNLFYKLFPLPIAVWGRAVEKFYLWLYKDTPTMAISPSTKQDLINEGFRGENVTVLPMGVSLPEDIEKYRNLPKEKNPTLIYLGRINKQKGAEDALEMFKIVKERIPNVKLWFVGSGEKKYLQNFKFQISNFKFQDSVQFHGHVSNSKKFELLVRAHVLIVPSIHEGWGLVVSEANSVGTPAIVYNVPGLRDTVEHDKTGLIVKRKPESMAESVIDLLNDNQKRKSMSKNAQKRAKIYSWEETAKAALLVVGKVSRK